MVRLVLVVPVIFLVVLSILPSFADTGVMSVVSGKTYQVDYNANGVKIQDIETNPTYDEITISVQVSSQNAILELTIPRVLLDSKQGNNDIPFIAVVDGTLGNVEEKNPTLYARTISIQLAPGNTHIEIIGTYIAMSGPTGNAVPSSSQPSTTQPQHMSSQQVTNQSASTQTSTSQVQRTTTPQVSPQTKLTTQTNITLVNNTTQTNISRNIVFKIPYVPNIIIRLSSIDLAVIGAIILVVMIVIASSARRGSTKIVKKSS